MTSWLHDRKGREVQRRDPRGLDYFTTWTPFGQVSERLDPAGNRVSFVYDAAGDLVHRHEYEGALLKSTMTHVYDALNQRIATTNAAGETTLTFRDSQGHVREEVDSAGFRSVRDVDGRGLVTRLRHEIAVGALDGGPSGGLLEESTVFDESGNARLFADGEGNLVTLAHDVLDRWVELVVGNLPPATTTYVAGGKIATTQDGNGSVVAVQYDAAGRPVQRTITPGPGVGGGLLEETLAWNAAGWLSGADVEQGSQAISVGRFYDGLGRWLREVSDGTFGSHAVERQLDGNGNLTQLVLPSGLTVSATPDPDHDLVGTLALAGGVQFEYGYLHGGRVRTRRTRTSQGVEWILTRTYDAAHRVTSHAHTALSGGPTSGTILAGFTYGLDQRGLRIEVADIATGVLRHHVFDGLGRLTRLDLDLPPEPDGPPSWIHSERTWTLDRADNRTSVTNGGVITAYTLSGTDNRYASVGGVALGYDQAGNLAWDGVRARTYDGLHRLRETRDAAGALLCRHEYDALGRKVVTEIPGDRRIIDTWADQRILERRIDLGADGTVDIVCSFVHGNELDEVLLFRRNGIDYYPLTDAAGSTVALADAGGTIVERYSHDAFGIPVITVPGQPGTHAASPLDYPFLFHGAQWDAPCRAYSMRARFYDPALGRFLTPDPTGAADGLNVYAFCRNDPVNHTDPTGLQTGWHHHALPYNAVFPWALDREIKALYELGPTPSRQEVYQAVDRARDYARQAADASMAWDSKRDSQEPKNAAWHGMIPAGENLTREGGFAEVWVVITGRLNLGTAAGLGEALHVIQDIVSEGHRLKEYSGMTSLILDDGVKLMYRVAQAVATHPIPSTSRTHIEGDTWPDTHTSNLMKGLSSLTVAGELDTVKAVLEVVLKLEGGQGGSFENKEDGAVVVTLSDGTVISFSESGVEKWVQEDAATGTPDDCPVNDWSIVPDPWPTFPEYPPLLPNLDPGGWIPYDPVDRRELP